MDRKNDLEIQDITDPLLLRVSGLSVAYRTEKGAVKALDDVSFEIEKGLNFGLVGESGCGKTTLLKAVVGALPPNAAITGGQIVFEGRELTSLDNRQMRRIRWRRISMITQSAMNALDPVYKVGDQIIEAIQAHQQVDAAAAKQRVEQMFALVGIDRGRFSEYPHQFSGGMRQRAIIAMSLILEPALVIADEPTTSLDVIVQDQIFKNIRKLQDLLGFSMLLVTHDIAVVIENCADIGVMYGGKIMEAGRMKDVINQPFHPYTMGLKNAFPNIRDRRAELISIPGVPPSLLGELRGCRFFSRCPFSTEICAVEAPPLVEVEPRHRVACHHMAHAEQMRQGAKRAETWLSKSPKEVFS